jgi:hypothetical protein
MPETFEIEALKKQIETEFAERYPSTQYLYFMETREGILVDRVLEYLEGHLTESQLMKLNLPQFEPLVKPITGEFRAHWSEESLLFPEYGEKTIKHWTDPFSSPPIIFYAILSKEEFKKLQQTLDQVPLKKYIHFLQKCFIEYEDLFTNKWHSYDKAPFLVVNIDSASPLKFYKLKKHYLDNNDIRMKTGRFSVKDDHILTFNVQKDNQNWDIHISTATSEKFKYTFSFEWYETEQYFSLVIFDVPLQVPTSLWNTVLLLSQGLLKSEEITDGEDVYTIPVIAFEVNRPYFISGESYFIQKVFSESFPWRTIQIYYPPNQPELAEFIHQGLAILDKNKISFLPEKETLDAIIFSYGIRGIAAGQVNIDRIGDHIQIFVDLSQHATITIEIILHELLHKTSCTINFIKPLRESFTTLATYLLLPPESLEQFEKNALVSPEKESRWSHLFGPDSAYTIFPLFLYHTFLKESKNIAAFINLYLSQTEAEFLTKLPEVFSKKFFYEELTYLADFRNEEKYPKYDWDYMHETDSNSIILQIIAIYFFKEELAKNYTYSLAYLSSRSAGFQEKGKPQNEADFQYYNLDSYIKKLPPAIIQAVRRILSLRA